MSTHEKDINLRRSAESNSAQPNYSRRKRTALGLGFIGVTAAFYVIQSGVPEFLRSGSNPKDDNYGEIVKDAYSVKIFDGARVRYYPAVPGNEEATNLGGTVDENNEYITIDTPNGIRILDNGSNGDTWLGVQTVDIKASLPVNKSLLEAAEKDRGGTVWISTQRAEANFDYTPEPTDPTTLVNNG
jgi:hypothetical protein